METRILKIDEDTKLDRLDKVLAEKLDFSRKRIKDLLDEGNVLVNQKVMKASYKVCIGDEIEVSIPELDSTEVLPEPIDLDIVYEDHDIIVINKPKGMVVHPAPGHYSGTLVNALLYHCKDLSGINGVMRPGIVHRIDKDTSGLLVVAKNDVAHEALSQQLQDKTCHREYVAIVHKPFTHEYGTIHAPIGRDEKDRQKIEVTIPVKGSIIRSEQVSNDMYVSIDLVEEIIERQLKKYGFFYNEVDYLAPVYHKKDSALIRCLMEAYQEVTGDMDTEPMAIGGATYARALPNAVAFGPLFPYEEELAHEANEFLSIESLQKMTEIFVKGLYKLMTEYR